jgi:hypothetical protein
MIGADWEGIRGKGKEKERKRSAFLFSRGWENTYQLKGDSHQEKGQGREQKALRDFLEKKKEYLDTQA